MATKKTPAPSKTVTKEQLTELNRLNAKQLQSDLAEREAYSPYESPVITTGSDEAVNAALAAANEAETQANLLQEMGARRYVNENAPSNFTIAQRNAVLPASERMGDTVSQGQTTNGKYTASDGTSFTNFSDYLYYQDALDNKIQSRKSAYDLLFEKFANLGLGSLVEPIKELVSDSTVDPSQYSFILQNDPKYNKAYKARFAANDDRILKGLRPLDPATYLRMEDQYQQVMRNYGLPESYWKTGPMGVQEGFTKLLANDVDPTELEDRILNAQKRVINANPEVIQALKNFYPDISNGDILAYVLDPKNAISNIKKKISTAEIGGAAIQAGLLGTSPEEIAGYTGRASELQAAGVTGQQYQQASPFLTTAAQRGSQLADIYGQTPYGRTQAEAEAFNIAGGSDAATQRRKLKALEEASFSGKSGAVSGSLSRDRAISNYMMGAPGAGAF